MSCTIYSMDNTDITLNDRLVKRLNDSIETLAEGRQMQNSRPFKVSFRGGSMEHIGLDAAPRDVEILADILEEIERGSFQRPSYLPTSGQTSLPVG